MTPSVYRHVETVVKPWINANARQREIFGTFEAIDGHTEWDLIQIVEDTIGGSWDTALGEWDARRDAMLDLIGKAIPGAFKPALQIDGTDARLLVEALSVRWSYEQDRREKRTVWHYVANAFSLLLSGIQPTPSKEEIKVLSPLDETNDVSLVVKTNLRY
jgi:hypothetical protein